MSLSMISACNPAFAIPLTAVTSFRIVNDAVIPFAGTHDAMAVIKR